MLNLTRLKLPHNEVSPHKRIEIKIKRPALKLNTTLQKVVKRPSISEYSTPKYVSTSFQNKPPITSRKVSEVPKLLFTKINHVGDSIQLSSNRSRRHKYTLSENFTNPQPSFQSSTSRPSDSKLTKHIYSPHRIIESISSTESLSKSYSSRKPIDEDRKLAWKMTKLPASPASVLKLFMHKMSHFEQAEILGYSEIYYLGLCLDRKEPIKSQVFDDDRGDYKIMIGDQISYRYEIVQVLGRGSFGQVVKAIDHKTKQEVALKVIRNKSRFHEQALVEVKILKYLKEKDPNDQHCVVHLIDHFSFRKHMCITFELLNMNLYEFLKLNSFQGLSPSLIKRFASQLLEALALLNRHKVIHCDLKPENILLKSEKHSALKVIDFGSSCFYEQRIYTYIQSRFYRAPEIILGIPYNTSIDMWSFGCILIELFTGYPIFPGESEAEQIQCIMEVLGLPPASVLERATRKRLFFDGDHPKITPNSRGKVRFPGKKPLKDLLRKADTSFFMIVSACLEWDPLKRITPEEAKEHEWFSDSPKLNKSNSRGGSAQPHQGLTPRHIKKSSEVPTKATMHRSTKRSVNYFK